MASVWSSGLKQCKQNCKQKCKQADTHQVDGDGAADEEAGIDVHGVVFKLDNARQAADDAAHDEGENQQRFEQLGGVG